MSTTVTAQCMKEIYWNGKTYRPGDPIAISREDMRTLTRAGCIVYNGDEYETATMKRPENTARRPKR